MLRRSEPTLKLLMSLRPDSCFAIDADVPLLHSLKMVRSVFVDDAVLSTVLTSLKT